MVAYSAESAASRRTASSTINMASARANARHPRNHGFQVTAASHYQRGVTTGDYSPMKVAFRRHQRGVTTGDYF
jgi:hypothetical protein